MATAAEEAECTQDSILRFLTVRGGRVRNKDLLEHFKAVLSPPPDSDQCQRRTTVREAFKGYVDAVAFVKADENAVKWVCLKKKYRRLIAAKEGDGHGASGSNTGADGAGAAGTEVVTAVGQSVHKDGSRCDNEVEIMGSLGTQQQQQPCATEPRTERTTAGEECATSGETHQHHHHHQHAEQVSPAGSGYGNDKHARSRGETLISRAAAAAAAGTILVDNRRSEEKKVESCHPQPPRQEAPVIAVEGIPRDQSGAMGNVLGLKSENSSSSEESVEAPDIPRIAIIEASPLPAAADGSMFDLPPVPGLPQHGGVGGGLGHEVQSGGGTASEQGLFRRRNSVGSQHSLGSGPSSDDDDDDDDDNDQCHSRGGGSLSGSEDNATTPRGSRQNFIELMMNNSPQVRRGLANRNSAHLSRCSNKGSDGDSASVASSSLAGDEYRAPVALDPLEHAWMMCASDGEWAGLQGLLADEPGLLLRRDFVTGFTCLHWAAKLGRAELLALVVNFARQHAVPVDVDVRSGAGGYTPLHLAAMHGHADVLKLLVGAYGADVEVRDYSGRKACQYLTGNNATIDLRDIAGASAGSDEERDPDGAANGATASGGARRRLSNVLHPHLNPLRLLHPHRNDQGADDNDETDGQRHRSKPVRRKSSLGDMMRPKLQRLRDRTSKIVHSVSFHDAEDLRATRSGRGSFKRPKSKFLG